MDVIDFWLIIFVFPSEAKSFEKKLMCTAWDLCNENMQYLTTGFSGTNDTRDILPLPIAQDDLPELQHANEVVDRILSKRSWNRYY